MKIYIDMGAKGQGPRSFEVEVAQELDGSFRVRVGGMERAIEDMGRGTSELALIVDGRAQTHWFQESAAGLHASNGMDTFTVRARDEQARLAEALLGGRTHGTASAEIRSIMPGIVTRILTSVGAAVERDVPLLTIEAMKMENEVRSERACVIRKVHVVAGVTVNAGDLLVEVGPAPEGD